MNYLLNVYGLPALVTPEELAGGTVVVIDVLRASTTIVHALEAGAKEIIPCLEIEDAHAAAAGLSRAEVVLGGERGGLPIDGFDLGNSPTEYTPQTVGDRTVVFTTTNGTKAIRKCGQADRVLIGSFVNAAAVYRQLIGQSEIHLLCAGTRGEHGQDDTLMAGLLVDRLQRAAGETYQLNAEALTARENWTSAFAVPYATGAEPLDPKLLADKLRDTIAGRNVMAIGKEADILTASQLDRFDIVPEVDPATFGIRLG